MSEWVAGKDVDWEGWAEALRVTERISPTLIVGDRFITHVGEWLELSRTITKFRRPVPDADADGERWRKMFSGEGYMSVIRLQDGKWKFVTENDSYGIFNSIAELDAYLAEPEPKKIAVMVDEDDFWMELKPGESQTREFVGDTKEFKVTVERAKA